MTRVVSDRSVALHLRGILLPDGVERDVFIADGRVSFRPPRDVSTILTRGYLIPGLVDAHAHLGLASPAPQGASPEERARASARAHLVAGVLVIREPGGPDRASAGIGPHEGLPRTVTGGRFLAPPGQYFPGVSPRWVREVDLPAAAEEEARASGAWVKLIGDWVGADGRMRPNFGPDAMAAAVRQAHAAGARVAVHSISAAGTDAAIEAGVDSIEHGWGLREDQIAAMAARGIALVPTLTILAHAASVIAGLELEPAAGEAALAAVRRHPAMVRQAAEAGVMVLAGTDAGMGPHGMVRDEVRRLVKAGLSRQAALAAGSWEARRFLGFPGIEEGAPADLVAYSDDPRTELALLARPILRILDGHIVPGPVD